jgi:hypothetical protein
MNNTNIFERASRIKVRFATEKGFLNVEDLWTLPLTKLDTLAKNANKQLKNESEESFITPVKSSKNEELEGGFEILKHIISVRLKENEDAKIRSQRLEELSLLRNIQANKKVEELHNLSSEEIEKRIQELSVASN